MLIFKKIGLIALTALSTVYLVISSYFFLFRIIDGWETLMFIKSLNEESFWRHMMVHIMAFFACICAIILFTITLRFTIRFCKYNYNSIEKLKQDYKETIEINKQIKLQNKRQKKSDKLKAKIERLERGE